MRYASIHSFIHHASLHDLRSIHKLIMITSTIFHIRILLSSYIATNDTKCTGVLDSSVLIWILEQTILNWAAIVLHWVILHSIVLVELIWIGLGTVLHGVVLCLLLAVVVLRLIHTNWLNSLKWSLIVRWIRNVLLFISCLLSGTFWAYWWGLL